jgi:Acetyltransferase (GNAT) domain
MTPDRREAAQLVVSRYAPADADSWEELVRSSANGTFLHTRRYLGYHGDRFKDLSLLVRTPEGALVGVLPAARVASEDGDEVVSHPGITFGGLVTLPGLRGAQLVDALRLALDELASLGIQSLGYRPVPAFARRQLSNEDSYAVFRLGGVRTACHLSAVVDLARRPPVGPKMRNMLRKAERSGLTLHDGVDRLPAFWAVLNEQLAARFGATPVHSLGDITDLAGRFPEEIGLRVAVTNDGQVVAGALTYRYTDDVVHTQYLTSDDAGRRTAALDLVCDSLIRDAAQAGLRYLSFGPSTHEDGRVLNDSLYRFKHSFGATGVTVEHFRIPCRAP